ncbi:MAG: hypothetical protein EHM58_09615 [Ignavibacteriae bacterium]|nr:MAG: hypothetical protein EHM58_09615 [Ignavibacteriota bacterium]
MKKIIKINKYYYFIPILIAVIFPLFLYYNLPSIVNIFNYKDMDISNKISATGSFITYLGFIYTIYQLLKIKTASIAAIETKRDIRYSVNYNSVLDLSQSIMNACRDIIYSINQPNYNYAVIYMRELRKDIMSLNSALAVIKEKDEFKEIEDLKKHLNDLTINLNDLEGGNNVTHSTQMAICQRIDNILIDATNINLIKNYI